MEDKTEAVDEAAPTKRQIIIETDGNSANIIKADVAGTFEFVGILEGIINQLRK